MRPPQPVRSTCVRTACALGGASRTPLRAPRYRGSALVGRHSDRRRRQHGRLRHRRQRRRRCVDVRVLCALRHGLSHRGARRSAQRVVHRRHPATAAAVRHGARRVLPDAQQRGQRHQGPADQLWVSADRALPPDVLHLCGRARRRHRAPLPRRLSGGPQQPGVGEAVELRHRRRQGRRAGATPRAGAPRPRALATRPPRGRVPNGPPSAPHPHGRGMPGRRTPPRSSNRSSISIGRAAADPARTTHLRPSRGAAPGHRGSVRRRGSRPRRASPASRPASASAATNAPRAGPATTSTSRARAAPTIRFHGCGTAAAMTPTSPSTGRAGDRRATPTPTAGNTTSSSAGTGRRHPPPAWNCRRH